MDQNDKSGWILNPASVPVSGAGIVRQGASLFSVEKLSSSLDWQPLNEDPDISGSSQLFIAYKNVTKKTYSPMWEGEVQPASLPNSKGKGLKSFGLICFSCGEKGPAHHCFKSTVLKKKPQKNKNSSASVFTRQEEKSEWETQSVFLNIWNYVWCQFPQDCMKQVFAVLV